jgi:hypothetical protein
MFGENRKSFRILTPAGRERALLRVGKKKLTVQLVDESAGGFAIACQGLVNAALGEVLELRTPGGLHEVKVIRREEFSNGVLIGLERLRDLEDPQQPGVQSSCFDYVWSPYIAGGPASGGGFKLGMLVGLLVAAALLLVVGQFLSSYRPPQANLNVLPVADRTVNEFEDKARRAAAQRQAELEAARLGVGQRAPSGGFSSQWKKAPGRIADALGLSLEQRKQIEAIMNPAAATKSSADQDAQIRQVLTAQQAQRWQQMKP